MAAKKKNPFAKKSKTGAKASGKPAKKGGFVPFKKKGT